MSQASLPTPPSSAGLLGPDTPFLLATESCITPCTAVEQLRRGFQRRTLAVPELDLPSGVVVAAWRAPVQCLPVKLSISSGADMWELLVSPNQPFATADSWLPASSLKRGVELVSRNGSVTVVSVVPLQGPHSLYDIRVRGSWGLVHPSGIPLVS